MKSTFLFLATIMLLFTACKTTVKGKNGVEYKSAVEYNDYIVNKQADIAKQMIKLVSESQTDLTKAEQTRQLTEANVTKTIADIEGMPDWKGNTDLRDKGLSLFKFYQAMFATDFKRMIDMQKDGEVTPEEESEYNKITAGITSKEGKLDRDFKTAQTDFAKTNGFKVAANSELQKDIDEMGK